MSFLTKRLPCLLFLCASALQAHAVGRMADVTVVDRNTGATLPVYYHKGQYWVPGIPGARYAISIRNTLGERLMAVTSVDGVNVVTGATASWSQTGYVFAPYNSYQITGWRKSNTEIAAFEFSAAADSYANLTDRPGQIGVIGVALFKERVPDRVPPPLAAPYDSRQESMDGTNSPKAAGNLSHGAAKESRADAARAAESPAASSVRPSSPKLGTGHGEREDSYVGQTTFERLQRKPNEVIAIRYDSRENLVAAGIINERPARLPNPFPNSDSLSYVPDPPVRRY